METVIVWILSVQLWTDPPPVIKIVYTKEFTTHEACMQARESWIKYEFQTLCLAKSKAS